MATINEVQRRGRDTVQIWVDAFDEHDLLTHASAIAFQVLKSLVPLSLLGITLIGAVGRRDLWSGHLAPPIKSRVDPPVFHALDFAVEKIFARNSGPLIAFAALLTIWYVSGGVRAIIGAINRIYGSEDDRPFWLRWVLSIGLAACVVAGIVGAARRSRTETGRRLGDPGRCRTLARRGRRARARDRPPRTLRPGRAAPEEVGEHGRGARGRHLDRDLDRLPLVRQLDRQLQERDRAADRVPGADGLRLRIIDRLPRRRPAGRAAA